METIFYYVETGEILSKKELSGILYGFVAPRGSIGVVNKNQTLHIKDGKIENVNDVQKITSVIPKEDVNDVFTDIVNLHNEQVKKGYVGKTQIHKDELDEIVRKYSLNTLGKYESSTEVVEIHHLDRTTEARREKIQKTIQRRKTMKKVAIASVLAAMSAISAVSVKYAINIDKISHDTYDVLTSENCYIKNDVEHGKTYVAINDHNKLYGSVNPDYQEITTESLNSLYEVLISQGYTNEEAVICLSSLIPSNYIGSLSTSSSFSEKLDFVLTYESLNYNR